MYSKRGKCKWNRKTTKIVPLLNTMDINDGRRKIAENMLKQFHMIREDKETDFERKRKDNESLIRSQFQQLIMSIPSNLQSMTVGHLLNNGTIFKFGSTNDDTDDGHCIGVITIDLNALKKNDESSIIGNQKQRHVFGDVSSLTNTASGRKTKKTPFNGNNTNSKRKGLRNDLSGSIMAYDVSVRILRSATKSTKLMKSKVAIKDTTEGVLYEENSTLRVDSVSECPNNLSPYVRLAVMPLHKKVPRPPNSETDKEIVVCSKMGTPLVIDEKWLKIHLKGSTNDVSSNKKT